MTLYGRRYNDVMGDPAELDRILARGAERARAVAEPKLGEMKERMGFMPPLGGAS